MTDKVSPVIGVDIKEYSQEENNRIKKNKRRILNLAIEEAIEGNKKEMVDYLDIVMEGGDGFMATINDSSPSSILEVFINFIDSLKIQNREHEKDKIKVRGVIHHGAWEKDKVINKKYDTAIGSAIDQTARYLNATPLRNLLDKNIDKTDFAFGISPEFYEKIKNSSQFDRYREHFKEMEIEVKTFKGKMYLYTGNNLEAPLDNEMLQRPDMAIFHTSMVNFQNKDEICKEKELAKDSIVKDFPELSPEDVSGNNWQKYIDKNEEIINDVKNLSPSNLHIFPLSQIPLLIHFGYLLRDTSSNVKIYQYDKDKKEWVYKNDNNITMEPPYFNNKTSESLVVSLQITSQIDDKDIKDIIDIEKNAYLKLSIAEPKLNKALYQEEVEMLKRTIGLQMEKNLNYKEIHLFYAGPAGLAVEIGRLIRRSMWPKVHLYNFQRNRDVKYERAFIINEQEGK